MKNLKKDLNAVNKELKALAKKVDKLIVVVGKLEKPKVTKKPKAKIVKKKPVKKTITKKASAKKSAAKKTTKTAIGTILGIINGYKRGVNTATLKKKTGFADHKIHTIIYNLKKQGKIKSGGKGVYLKA